MDEQFEKARRDELIELVKSAERSKAEIFKPPGKDQNKLSVYEQDDEFFHYTAHIDEATIAKIEMGKFVDLAKLLPKEKVVYKMGD